MNSFLIPCDVIDLGCIKYHNVEMKWYWHVDKRRQNSKTYLLDINIYTTISGNYWHAKSVARHWSPAAPGVIATAPRSIKVWDAHIINWLSGLKQHEYFCESSSSSSYELSILSQIVCKVTLKAIDLVFSVVIDDSADPSREVNSLTKVSNYID